MFKVLPTVERFGTAIIGPQSEKKVSSLANPFRGLGGGVRGRGRNPGALAKKSPLRGRSQIPAPEREASKN